MNRYTLLQTMHRDCLKYGDFTLHSGATSKYFVDVPLLLQYPHVTHELLFQLSNLMRNPSDTMTIIGIDSGGTVLAALLQQYLHDIFETKSRLVRWLKTKEFDTPIDTVCSALYIVDDVITKGTSVCEVLDAIEPTKLQVRQVLTVLDREEDGVFRVRSRHVPIQSLFTITELMHVAPMAGDAGSWQHD